MRRILFWYLLFCCSTFWSACGQQHQDIVHSTTFAEMNQQMNTNEALNKLDTAYLAAGCYWCVEVQFQQLKGVEKVVSGFTDGHVPNPTYKEVCTGTTGHAEVCQIVYNPDVISFDALLAAFFVAHDPTQLNRQGNDIGTQYRSGIYYTNDAQKQKANYYIAKLNEEEAYPSAIVTEVKPFSVFYKAEDYHQNYYNQNSGEGYCQMVIKPKLEKFKKVFAEQLK